MKGVDDGAEKKCSYADKGGALAHCRGGGSINNRNGSTAASRCLRFYRLLHQPVCSDVAETGSNAAL